MPVMSGSAGERSRKPGGLDCIAHLLVDVAGGSVRVGKRGVAKAEPRRQLFGIAFHLMLQRGPVQASQAGVGAGVPAYRPV